MKHFGGCLLAGVLVTAVAGDARAADWPEELPEETVAAVSATSPARLEAVLRQTGVLTPLAETLRAMLAPLTDKGTLDREGRVTVLVLEGDGAPLGRSCAIARVQDLSRFVRSDEAASVERLSSGVYAIRRLNAGGALYCVALADSRVGVALFEETCVRLREFGQRRGDTVAARLDGPTRRMLSQADLGGFAFPDEARLPQVLGQFWRRVHTHRNGVDATQGNAFSAWVQSIRTVAFGLSTRREGVKPPRNVIALDVRVTPTQGSRLAAYCDAAAHASARAIEDLWCDWTAAVMTWRFPANAASSAALGDRLTRMHSEVCARRVATAPASQPVEVPTSMPASMPASEAVDEAAAVIAEYISEAAIAAALQDARAERARFVARTVTILETALDAGGACLVPGATPEEPGVIAWGARSPEPGALQIVEQWLPIVERWVPARGTDMEIALEPDAAPIDETPARRVAVLVGGESPSRRDGTLVCRENRCFLAFNVAPQILLETFRQVEAPTRAASDPTSPAQWRLAASLHRLALFRVGELLPEKERDFLARAALANDATGPGLRSWLSCEDGGLHWRAELRLEDLFLGLQVLAKGRATASTTAP